VALSNNSKSGAATSLKFFGTAKYAANLFSIKLGKN
jgi:hypothetical protein